jgi:uncharacterized membrane protein YuzA (DUF378 family)
MWFVYLNLTANFLLVLKDLLKNDPKKLQLLYDRTGYNKLATNYTSGFLDYFKSNTSPEQLSIVRGTNTRELWEAILGGLGVGLVGFTDYNSEFSTDNTTTDNTTTNNTTPQPTFAELQAIKDKAEADAKRKNIITYSLIGLGVIILGMIFYFAFRKKPQTV